MAENPFLDRGRAAKSPLEPNECAVWANNRMKPEHREIMEWVVVKGQLKLQRL